MKKLILELVIAMKFHNICDESEVGKAKAGKDVLPEGGAAFYAEKIEALETVILSTQAKDAVSVQVQLLIALTNLGAADGNIAAILEEQGAPDQMKSAHWAYSQLADVHRAMWSALEFIEKLAPLPDPILRTWHKGQTPFPDASLAGVTSAPRRKRAA